MYPEEVGIQLICPDCRTRLRRAGEAYVCENRDCRRDYPILDEIPKLIADERPALDLADWESRLQTGSAR
jgi:uncharacterized protein YbaR (Trm112 family)